MYLANAGEIEVLQIDEIVTFCKKNAVKSGFGLQLTETGIKLLILRQEIVDLQHILGRDSGKKTQKSL